MEDNKTNDKTQVKEKQKAAKVMDDLAHNYMYKEKALVNQLQMQTSNHHYTTGTFREEVWKSLFETMIPKKYCMEQGVFIIDSEGNISREVDLAVFDEMYTPYIFKYEKIKFIPIEAVAIVIQCKSKVENTEMEQNLKEWTDSIDCLKTSMNSVVRIATGILDNELKSPKGRSQTATRPIKILCATEISNPLRKKTDNLFDIILYIKNEQLVKSIKNEDAGFDKWYYMLNHKISMAPFEEELEIQIKNRNITPAQFNENRTLRTLVIKDSNGEENIIMSLTFQLNQLLMLINNPLYFPHYAYVERFNKIFKENKTDFYK